MSIVDHHGEVEYPFSQKTVFKAIMEAAPNINGLTLDSADEISGRVTFKAGVSLASWGENIPVQLIKVTPTETLMKEKEDEVPIGIEGFGERNSNNYVLNIIVVLFLFFMLVSCNGQPDNSAQIAEIEKKYQDSLSAVRNELKEAKSKIELLSYPADQRLQKAKGLLDAGELDNAKAEIENLKSIFPNSSEASSSNALLSKIEELKEAKRKEEERIKALGFKALPEQTTVKVDYNTVTYSSISVGNRFVFDAYDDRWFYRDADRGNKYVTMQMSVTSTSHSPALPELGLYTISGDRMILEGTFDTEFARWRDYGAYLGNYHDSSNDFAKVSTVKFKLGLQVSNEKLSQPYAIVLKKTNALSYHYDRFSNPPISYIGSAGYPSSLTLDDFKNGYVLIKRYNLK